MAGLCEICENICSQVKEKSVGNAYSSSLIISADKGHEKCVKILIEAGADVNYPNYDKTNEHSNITQILAGMMLIPDNRYSLQKKEKYTALMLASRNGHDKCVEILLEAGADVNKSNADGVTALMHAATTGYANCIEKLLLAGADVNRAQDEIRDSDGFAPLMNAALTGNGKLLDVLIKAGADVNKSVQGYTAIACAIEEENEHFVEKLFKAGADVNLKNMHGKTPLNTVSRCGLVEVMKLLLQA